jgi:hypothetical protein
VARHGETPHTLLTRHFLRRFLENDLVSPDADRSQFVAVLSAGCFSTTLFITVAGACLKYVIGTHTPGQAAVASLDDKFFFIGLSMIVAALLAASQWDALVIEARDAAILEPLPVPVSTIRRAKLSAIAQLGAGAALLLNLAPSVVFPLLLVVKQHVSLFAALWIVVTHAVVSISAAAFGYAAIVALREVLFAVLGTRVFTRVSPLLQGALVIALGSALLLLPGARSSVEQRALARSTTLSPPAWFLGLYEVASGTVLIDAPRVRLAPRLQVGDRIASARYRAHRQQFAELARAALAAIAVVMVLGALAFAWNARRLPRLATVSSAASYRRSAVVRRLSGLLTGRDTTVSAGFHFTLAVITRSRPHRLAMAGAAAVGMAMTVVSLSGLDLDDAVRDGRAVPRLLMIQPFLYGALLVGFRHAIRVPATLPANWIIKLGWREETKRYLSGARRAAVAILVVPALAVVFPLIAVALGPAAAMAHAAIGLAGAALMLEVLLLGYAKVPFTCTYVPDTTMKAFGPVYVVAFLVGASIFARLQSAALVSLGATVTMVIGMLSFVVLLRLASRSRGPVRQVEFDEAPAGLQQLGLHV